MKRKIFNSLLLLTTFVAAMSVFVSCKDYDDDINDLRNQISTTDADLQSLLTEKVNNVNTEIANLQTQATNLQNAYDAADKQLQANIDALDAAVAIQIVNASNNAEDYADAAAAAAQAAAEAYADVQAAEAQVAAIAAAQDLVDDAIAKLTVQLEAAIQDAADGLASLQGYVDAQNASLSAQIEAAIAAANSADADLQSQIDAINAAIDGVNNELATISSELANKANSSDLTALTDRLEGYYAELIQADADLQKGIDAAQAAADAASELANQALTLAQSNADNIDILKTQIEKMSGDISGINSDILSIVGQIDDINGIISTINGAVAANTTAIGKLEEAVTGLEKVDADLQSQITVVGATADEALAKANENSAAITSLGSQLTSLAEANEAAHDAINASLESLGKSTSANAESIEKLESALTALQGLVEQNQKDIEDELAAGIAALESELATEVAALEKKITDSVDASAATLEEKIAAEVAALKIAIANAVTTAEAYVDVEVAAVADKAAEYLEAAVEKLNGSIDAAVDALTISIGELEDAYKKADQDLQDQIDALSEYLEEVAGDLQDGIDALNTALETNMKEIATALLDYATTEDVTTALQNLGAALSGKIDDTALGMLTWLISTYGCATTTYVDESVKDAADTAEANLEATYKILEAIIEEMQEQIEAIGDGNFQELWVTVNQNKDDIANLTALVHHINRYLGMEMKRLKSLVFAPTTYLNGIECIKFSTLSYTDWGENLYADAAPANGTEITVSDDSHTEEYLVSPSNVTRASIASLSFVANTATDVSTRAVSSNAPIAVAADSLGKNENGETVLKLNLKKTGTTSFGMDPDNFTIVSLKAVIAKGYMTDEEIEAGEEVAVYSDWARLCETSAVPYIHNAQAVDKETGKLDEEATDAHFYAFSDIYGEGGDVETTIVDPDDIKVYIIEPYVDYRETLDLSAYSIICDKAGNTYDPEAYGFSFEYNVVPCLVGDATSSVDQSLYASITDNVLTPTSADGEVLFSTEAINKTPVIQVVLKDDNNGAVVDVRYFVIKIYDKDAMKNYKNLDTDTLEYACGGMLLDDSDPANLVYGYTMTANALLVQQMCESYDMTEEVFFETYTELTGMYATQEEAAKVLDNAGATVDPALGSIVLNADHSLTWTIEYSDAIMKATDKDYANGYMEVSAWAVFANATAENIVTFELKLRLEIGKMEVVANHNETMWTKESGARVVNPQIETDEIYGNAKYKTTMILASLLQGYINDGIVPGEALDLVNKGDNAYFVFDEDRFDEIVDAVIEKLGDEYTEGAYGTNVKLWTVDVTGTTLYYDGDPAATITTDETGDVWIQLYESDNGSATSEPTEAAKLLVGALVPVKLVDEWCDLTDEFEHFDVNFLTPLAFSVSDTIITLTDIYSSGSSSVSLDNTIRITEDAINDHRVVWDNYVPSQTNADLVAWYGVEDPEYDMEHATTNLQKDGKLGTGFNVQLSEIQNKSGKPLYRIEYSKADNAFIFYNDSGSAISQAFMIKVEVTVKTKWQDAMVYEVYIDIEPGHGLSVKHQ